MSKYMYFYTDGKVFYRDDFSVEALYASCAVYKQNDDGYYKCVAIVTIPENK